MITINWRHEVEGRFLIEKAKVNAEGIEIPGTRVVVADWSDNMILNNGLDLMATQWGYANDICVGSGTGAVTAGQTALQNHIAWSNSEQSRTVGAQVDVEPYYGWARLTRRFNAGFGGGNVNIGEVGAGFGVNNSLYSRALVRDSNGDPAVIPILVDEVLDVTYELRSYPAESDATGTVTLKGVPTDFIIRSMSMHNGGSFVVGLGRDEFGLSNFDAWRFQNAVRGTVGIGPVTRTNDDLNSAAGGESFRTQPACTLVGGYVSGNYYRDVQMLLDLNQGNWGDGIGVFGVSYNFGAFQLAFDPPPVKVNTEKFTVVVRVSWGRR